MELAQRELQNGSRKGACLCDLHNLDSPSSTAPWISIPRSFTKATCLPTRLGRMSTISAMKSTALAKDLERMKSKWCIVCCGSSTNDTCSALLMYRNRRLLKAMGGMTMEERCMVPIRYKELYKKKLVDVMKSECGNKDFGTALQFLAVNPVEAECMMIDKACKGLGTDELLLSTIICGRTNKEMELLKVRCFDARDDISSSLLTFALCFPVVPFITFNRKSISKSIPKIWAASSMVNWVEHSIN
jgi:hypothetical protein